jgi:hypothetical protein
MARDVVLRRLRMIGRHLRGIAEMLGEDLVDALDISTLFAGFHVAVLRRSNLRQLDDSHLLEARVCIKL